VVQNWHTPVTKLAHSSHTCHIWSFSIGGVSDATATIPSLPDLLAVFGAVASIGGAAIGALMGKAATWRQSCEDIALGATIGGVAGCLLVFLVYLLVEVVGIVEVMGG
jgi:hypothetical protein